MPCAEEERLRLELALEIAGDAECAAAEFWKNWLWQAREMRAQPPSAFCQRLASQFGLTPDDIGRQWGGWYDLLTSWDLAALMSGCDVRTFAASYGGSHRRS